MASPSALGLLRLVYLLLILLSPWIFSLSSVEPHRTEVTARLEERQGVRILHLAGTPFEMGFQHGVLLRDEIRGLIQEKLYGEIIPSSQYPHPLLLKYTRYVDNTLPEEYRQEIQGLAQGAGVSYLDILLLNALSELYWQPDPRGVTRQLLTSLDPWRPVSLPPSLRSGLTPDNALRSLPPPLQMTFAALGEATVDGKLLHGFLWTEPALTSDLLIIIYEPEEKDAFVALSWPGAVGIWAGLNEEKISVVGMGWSSLGSSLEGVPMPFILRRVLEESGDLASALEILAGAERMSGYSVVLGDGKPADAAAVELTAHKWQEFLAEPDYILRGPWPLDPELAGFRTEEPEMGAYQLLSELLQNWRGQIDLNKAFDFMARIIEEEGRGSISGVVFAGSDLEVWVEMTGPQGKERFRLLNLLEEMEK